MARRIILAAAFLVVAAMGAFPPWVAAPEKHPSATASAGYHFILSPPPPGPRVVTYDEGSVLERAYGTTQRRFVRIDYARLAVQWVVVAALAGVVLLLPFGGRVSEVVKGGP